MIAVTGSLAFDYIMDFPGNFKDHIDPKKIHILNISFLVKSLKRERGGSAGNISYNLALLGVKNLIFGCIGENSSDYINFFRDAGVNVDSIKVIKGEEVSLAFIVADKSDNQIAGFYPGAMTQNHKLNLKDLSLKPDLVIISPNDPKAMNNFVKQAKELKIPYLYDPGMQLPRLEDKDLLFGIKGTKILIGNDYEIGQIKKRLGLNELKLLGLCEILITTLGPRGSIIKAKDKKFIVKPAKPLKVIDPTGAGDAYRAGFLTGFIRGFNLKTCGQMGSLEACYAVEKYGTTNHTFSKKEFIKRYEENFKDNLNL